MALFSSLRITQKCLNDLLKLGMLAERYFAEDPNTYLLKLRQLAEVMTQIVVSKAFRGDLVPQDPNDEPASKLLERLEAASSDKGQMKLSARKKR